MESHNKSKCFIFSSTALIDETSSPFLFSLTRDMARKESSGVLEEDEKEPQAPLMTGNIVGLSDAPIFTFVFVTSFPK